MSLKPTCYYNTKIPAGLFFEILESKKLKLLTITGKPKKGQLRRSWAKIFDEYFTLKDDAQLRLIIKSKRDILSLTNKVNTIENTLKVLALLQDQVVQDQFKESLQTLTDNLKKIGIRIDLTKPINQEILKNLNVNLAGIKTSLEIEKDNLKNLTTGAKTTFEDNCVSIESVLGRSITESVSLRKYISYEKQAKKQSDEQKRSNKRNKASRRG